MKVLLFLLLLPFAASSQISGIKKGDVDEKIIGSINQMGWKDIRLKRVAKQNEKPFFIIVYKDEQYRKLNLYKSIAFDDVNNVLDTLYNALKTAMQAANDYEVSFELGKKTVLVKTQKSGLTNLIWFSMSEGFFTLNRRELDKLFGK